MELVPVSPKDIAINAPLPWALYGKDRSLLVGEGGVISSEERVASLARLGLFREAVAMVTPQPENAAAEAPPEKAPANGEAKSMSLAFSDIRLKSGDRMQIEPPPILCQERLPVKYIGHLKDISVLVTLPSANGLPLALREGEKIVLRAFSEQNVFGFTATVERVCKIPFSYLHLSYPERVSGMVVRKSPRIKTNIIVTVQNPVRENGTAKMSGVLKNLSTTEVS